MNEVNLETWAEERTQWYGEVDPKPRKKKRWTKAQHFRMVGNDQLQASIFI